MCLFYLEPEAYVRVEKGIKDKRDQRQQFIDQIMDQITVALRKQRIYAQITGRPKHFYSIYRKMQKDNKDIDQIYDLFALRIFVNTVKDCYTVLRDCT